VSTSPAAPPGKHRPSSGTTPSGPRAGSALSRRAFLGLVALASGTWVVTAHREDPDDPGREEPGVAGRAEPGEPPPSAVATARVERAVHQPGAPTPSTRWAVTVDGGMCVVYPTPVETGEAHTSGSWTSFAFAGGPVTVVVTHESPVGTAQLLPLAKGVTPRVSGSTVTFTLTEPGPYELWVDGDHRNGLHVFANPLVPKPARRSVTHYYGPGYYEGTRPDGTALPDQTLVLTSGQSVYVDLNAYVRGHLVLGANAGTDVAGYRTTDVRASGYGVVDSQPHPSIASAGRPVAIHNTHGATVRGLKFLGVTHHGFQIPESRDVLLEDVGLINWRHVAGDTPDGYDGYGSSSVTLRRCFARVHDDASAIKNHKRGFGGTSPDGWVGSATDWDYEDCLFINGPGGNGSEVGYENFVTRSDGTPFVHRTPTELGRISYRRHTVVKFRDNVQYRAAALGIHLVDRLACSDVLYEDVEAHVFGGEHPIFVGSFSSPDYDTYADSDTVAARAKISDVTFRRGRMWTWNAAGTTRTSYPVALHGGGDLASGKLMTGISFEDWYINDVKVDAAMQAGGPDVWDQQFCEGPEFL